MSRRARLRDAVTGAFSRRGDLIAGYLHLLGGSIVRLFLSLVYFIALTSALGLSGFGVFATSTAVGMVIARIAAFGYGANIFIIAATRPRLLGCYLGVFGLWLLASMPLCVGLAMVVYWVSFPSSVGVPAYLTLVLVEVVLWRLIDMVAVINGGVGRFGRSAATYNLGFLARTAAALVFFYGSDHGVERWAVFYLIANLAAFAVTAAFLMPRVRIRLRRGSLFLRGRHALSLGTAYFFSMGQGESDKVLVLALGGEINAGLFATCIRLIDLTAMPVRAFNVLMIRTLLRNPAALSSARGLMLTEAGVALVSTAAFAVIALALWFQPTILGMEVAKAAPVLPLLWAVPALRNLIEYQAELLYAQKRIGGLFWTSGGVIIIKSVLIASIFWKFHTPAQWGLAMNAVFFCGYLLSSFCVYGGRRHRLAEPG